MGARLVAEHDSHFELHDGKAPFRVAKKGLSDDVAKKIRSMGAQKMSTGGEAMGDVLRKSVVAQPIGAPPVETGAPPPAAFTYDPEAAAKYPGYRGSVAPGATPEQAAAAMGSTLSSPGELENARRFPGYVGNVRDGETPEQAAARLGGVYVPIVNGKPQQPVAAAPPPKTGPAVPTEAQKTGAAPPPPAMATTKPAAPRMGGARAPAAPAAPNPFQQEQAATTEAGNIEAQAATEKAKILGDQQRALENEAIAAKQRQERAAADSEKYMGDIQKARQAFNQIDTTVDTGHLWATRSTPQKIAGIIGLALGAFGAAQDGVNRAAGLIMQAVDRDIDAQKSQTEFALKKGQAGIEQATSIYGLHRQQTQDALAADEVARASALGIVKNQLDQVAAKTGAPAAKANAALLSAKIGQKQAEFDAQARQRAFDNSIKKQNADADLLRAQAAANAKAGGKDLPATTVAELADMPTAQKALDTLGESFKRNKAGGWGGKASGMLPDALGRLLDTEVSRYNADALLAMQAVGKIMEGGKLAAGDEAKYRSMLPKAGDDEAAATANIERSKAFLQSLYENRVNALKKSGYDTSGFQSSGQQPAGDQNAQALAWAKANPSDPRSAAILKKLGAQ